MTYFHAIPSNGTKFNKNMIIWLMAAVLRYKHIKNGNLSILGVILISNIILAVSLFISDVVLFSLTPS